MDAILNDLRFAARRLRKSPGFTLVAVLILALGVGATTTIYSVVDAVLLQPLDYPESERIHRLFERELETGDEKGFSDPMYRDLKDAGESFAALGVYSFHSPNLTGAAEPEQLRAARVDAGFFEVFGIEPLLGRLPSADELRRGARVAVFGHALWQRQLGGRSDAVGDIVSFDGKEFTVVGVMPPRLDYPGYADLWLPLGDRSGDRRDQRILIAVGRLRGDVDAERAAAELATLGARFRADHPDVHDGHELALQSLHRDLVGASGGTLWTLFGAVFGLLAIVCLNLATLEWVRGLERRREIAVRSALGAGRGRVLRQLLIESLALAFAGGVFGVLIAIWALDLLIGLSPGQIPRLDQAAIDLPVLGFALLVTVLSGVAAGLLPALRSTRLAVFDSLRAGRPAGEGRRGPGLRGALVVGQVALTLVLLVSAGLLLRSFQALVEVDLGFDVERVLYVGFVLPPDLYPEPPQRLGWMREVRSAVSALPGVEATAAINFVPLSFSPGNPVTFRPPDPSGTASEEGSANERVITPGYFAALGIPLVLGRDFDDRDGAEAAEVVIVNETMARRVWPGRSPVGERLLFAQRDGSFAPAEVVGVAGDVRHSAPDQPPQMAVYRPYAQDTWSYMNLVVRAAAGPPEALIPAVQQTIWSIDPGRSLFAQTSAAQNLEGLISRPRFSSLLLALFSGCALLLSAVGIYSVLAFAVSRRRREIGVRMALGARRGAVRAMVVRQGLMLTLVGLGLGVVGALAATRLLDSLLFGVEPTDPATFVAVALVLLAAAWLAAYLPARRASRLDPMVVLREE